MGAADPCQSKGNSASSFFLHTTMKTPGLKSEASPDFWLTLRALPVSDIESCCEHAVRIADQLDVVVCFDFSGVSCTARPSDDPKLLAELWRGERDRSS